MLMRHSQGLALVAHVSIGEITSLTKMKSFRDHAHELLTMGWGIRLWDMSNKVQSQIERAGQEEPTHRAGQEPCL